MAVGREPYRSPEGVDGRHNEGMAREVSARSLTTKRAVGAEFARHGSGYVLAAALGSALFARVRRGRPGPGDLLATITVVALQPFVEWSLHRYVLHGPARTVRGRILDPGEPHRGHHRVPDDVSGALLGGGFAVADAAVVAGVAATVSRVVGGPAAALTGIAAGEAGLAAYEWAHLLSHSGYRPRTAWFRRVRRHHLRHHFRDEQRDFGVTSALADRLFHTVGEAGRQPTVTGTRPAPRRSAQG